MPLLDLILNLVALLLWLNWRAVKWTAATPAPFLSLASALKRTPSRAVSRRGSLLALVALLVLRAFLYRHLGAAQNWTPALPLGTITLHFRNDSLARMSLFSGVGFAWTLAAWYWLLLLLSAVNRSLPPQDPIHRIVRLQLGPWGRLPAVLQLLVPLLAIAVLLLLLHRPLARLGWFTDSPTSFAAFQRGLATSLGLGLWWRYPIYVLLGLHILNSYVYLGSSPFWSYITGTARNLLQPLRWLPLGIGKADLAPFLGLLDTWVIAHYAGLWLARWYQHPF